jgi:hypothetical protein
MKKRSEKKIVSKQAFFHSINKYVHIWLASQACVYVFQNGWVAMFWNFWLTSQPLKY